MGEPAGKTTISVALYYSGLYGRVVRWKSLLVKGIVAHFVELSEKWSKHYRVARKGMLESWGF